MMSGYQALIRQSACDIVNQLRSGTVTPLDLLDALESRISAIDNQVNALPTLCFTMARERAKALMARPLQERGLLCGMPIAIKDLVDVAGVCTTRGSVAFANNIPARSDLLVEHLEAQGAVVYAKSNTAEFGGSGHTDNEVFGVTRNPWDLSRSSSGSSGGAAAALAGGMAWLAHGSDSAGSLRSPASFCGVVGMRPSLNRVAFTPVGKVDRNFVAHGPMARNVEDTALLLDAMCGEHQADPRSMPAPATSFLSAARSGQTPKRVAYSPDLGITPVDPEVAAITRAAALRFADAGAIVEEAHPDLSEAHDCYLTLGVVDFGFGLGWLIRDEQFRERLSAHMVRRIQRALQPTAVDIERAEGQRLAMTRRTLEFFETYDLLLTPTTIVPPFLIENGPFINGGLSECAGTRFKRPFEWLGIAYVVTLICCPAVSLPCGFTRSGLPVGLQMIAPPRAEAQLLANASVLERILGWRDITPIDPRPAG